MSFVVGRNGSVETEAYIGTLGRYRALDGSEGAPVYVDLDGPHAGLIVGKRGYGKSYTMGVIAEELARTPGVAPTVIDPMGAFGTLTENAEGDPVPARRIPTPSIDPDALDPRSWCALLDLSPESGPGGLVWQAAGEASTLQGMIDHVRNADASPTNKRAAANHVSLARSWGVFDSDGIDADALASPGVTVVDVSELTAAPMNAVVRGVANALYRARVTESIDRLPWLLIDEAHAFFDGVAGDALELILTRGRAPGVSLVLATQRPSAVSDVAISQSDLLVSHRLTSEADIDALAAAQPTYMDGSLRERLPTEPGDVLIVDDATETVHAASVRRRDTPHGGDSPRASQR